VLEDEVEVGEGLGRRLPASNRVPTVDRGAFPTSDFGKCAQNETFSRAKELSIFLYQDLAMRVLLIAPGIADYCVEYANALANKAYVTLVAPYRTFAKHREFINSRVDLQLLDWPCHRSVRNLLFMYRLRHQIELRRPDVVHFLSEGVLWLNLVLPKAKKYGIVTTMHDISCHIGDRASRRVPRGFADWPIKHSDQVIVHGSVLRTAAENKYFYIKERLSVVPHVLLRRYRDFF
jgi:hypothetical protein